MALAVYVLSMAREAVLMDRCGIRISF
jgi:hypothetical protein